MRRLHAWLLSICLLPNLAAAQSAPSFEALSVATRRVADAYFEAYIARDWDRLAPLLAEQASFGDPTASGETAPQSVGKQATEKYFRQNYAPITRMEFKSQRTFYSGNYAVFEGELTWVFAPPNGRPILTEAMPLVTILRVEGDRVVEHRDYADYHPFRDARRKALAAG